MSGQNAILLNGSDEPSSSAAALHAILEPYFAVEILPRTCISDRATGSDVFDHIRQFSPVIIFLLLQTRSITEIVKLLEAIRRSLKSIPIIVVIEAAEPREVFELLKGGAADFLTPPFRSSDVLPRTWKVLYRGPEETNRNLSCGADVSLQQLIGMSPDFIAQVKRIPLLASVR